MKNAFRTCIYINQCISSQTIAILVCIVLVCLTTMTHATETVTKLSDGTVICHIYVGKQIEDWQTPGSFLSKLNSIRIGVYCRGSNIWKIVYQNENSDTNNWFTNERTNEQAQVTVTCPVEKLGGHIPLVNTEQLTIECLIRKPIRVKGFLGEGYVPPDLYTLVAYSSNSSKYSTDLLKNVPAVTTNAWFANLPVVLTDANKFTSPAYHKVELIATLERRLLELKKLPKAAYALDKQRFENRLYYVSPDFLSLVTEKFRERDAAVGASNTPHVIQRVLLDWHYVFMPGTYVKNGDFTNSVIIRNTVSFFEQLPEFGLTTTNIDFAPFNPWKGE